MLCFDTTHRGCAIQIVFFVIHQSILLLRVASVYACFSVFMYLYNIDLTSEEEEQRAHVTSLLEAKRRGISRSALRSHQPVARPVAASLSR